MILAHPQLDSVFEFSSTRVNSLVVEEPDLYRTLLCDLYRQQQGEPGAWILSDNDITLPPFKWVEVIMDCLHFELNQKSLLNKICADMEQTATAEQFFLRTCTLLSQLESLIDELAFEIPGDIICDKCSMSSILKSVSIRLRDDYQDPLERVVDYMELVQSFDRDKLFVLVGMRSLFSDRAMEHFMQTVLDHGYHVLLLDSVARKKIAFEQRLTIDNDLCEF